MLLAFADNIDRATEFTQKQLDYAANVSFPAYSLVFLFCAVMIVLSIHLLCFVRPDAKNRRECNTKLAEAVERFSTSSAVTAQLLDANNDWQSRHDSRLSRWEQEQLSKKCPLLDRPHDLTQPIPPNLTPIPHGA